MNEFLEYIKTLLKRNPSFINDNLDDFIYTRLISYNLGNNQEPLKNVEHFFEYWINRNRDHYNLQTFVSNQHPYFCQFANKDAFNIADIAVKLYIPLDEIHLYEGANRLFDFIASEGIHHNSKIGKKIRNDNIVVRVSNLEEAEKVINFVKNDSYIQEGLLNTNPFTININGVGVAKDGFYSYNTVLCESLARFINILNGKNRLDDLNIHTFHEYLEQMKDFGNSDLQMINSLQRAVTSGNRLDFTSFKSIISGTYVEVNKEQVFKEVVSGTYKKHGLQHTINAIARFRYNGDDSGFTRDNGLRFKLTINKITLEDVNYFLANFNLNSNNVIEDYINSIVNKSNKDYDYLVEAYKETYIKHGEAQANESIRRYILNGETKYITNQNNARDNLIEYVDFSRLYDSLRHSMNIDAYCTLEELTESFLEEMRINYLKTK